jgi:hypothetical protein
MMKKKKEGQVLVGVAFLVTIITTLAVFILNRSMNQARLAIDFNSFLSVRSNLYSCLQEGGYKLLRAPGYVGESWEKEEGEICEIEVSGTWPEKTLSCECRVQNKVSRGTARVRLVNGLINVSY